jgi:molybdate transport system substrate-binding protein
VIAAARRRTRRDWLMGAIALGIAACSRSRPTLRIAVASSLRDLLESTRAEFERAHSGVTLAFSFDASSTLSRQIEHADAFDVFVAADRESITRIAGRFESATIATVLTNRLVLVARANLEVPVASPAELATSDGSIVLCGESVPLGRYVRELL